MRFAVFLGLLACDGKNDTGIPPEDTSPASTAVCESDTARITGRVVTFVGQPLLNADVSFESSDGRVVQAELDPEGRFDEDLLAGTWTMLVVNSGCADGRKTVEVVACADEDILVELDCG